MLNPKLIELYGEDSRDMLMKLISEMGEDNASKAYVVSGITTRYICGVEMPGAIRTTSDSPVDIGMGIVNFIDKYTSPEDEDWIPFYGKENLEEGDLQLWLNLPMTTEKR